MTMSYELPYKLPLEIRLFGDFEIRVCGEMVGSDVLKRRASIWLLGLLLLEPNQTATRSLLQEKLFPEGAQPDFYLRRALSDLRKALGSESGALVTPKDGYIKLDLSRAFADVVVFDAAIGSNDLASVEGALRLYRGTILRDCKDMWMRGPREDRRRMVCAAWRRFGKSPQRDQALWIACLRQVACEARDDEVAARALMEALAYAGDRDGMVQVYNDLEHYCQKYFKQDPKPKTRNLYLALTTSSAPGDESESEAGKALERLTPPPLPRSITSLIGREALIQEVVQEVEGAQLVTLLGFGGVGKTRLALEVAALLQDRYPDGVWFVDLSGIENQDLVLVPQVLAAALKIAQDEQELPILETIVEKLRNRSLLIVLDNCEHLHAACVRVVHSLLTGCRELHLLLTSREALGVPGEKVRRVPTLPVTVEPSRVGNSEGNGNGNGQHDTRLLDARSQCASVQLFLERARYREERFVLSEQNLPTVLDICKQLDGLPLAIELAAAHVRSLSVAQIATRLARDLSLLRKGDPTDPERHRTLEATIEWSYRLLSADTRNILLQLSLFARGWTLEAAEAVCRNEENPKENPKENLHDNWEEDSARSVFDLMEELVDKSLVVMEHGERGEARYRLLETVRQFARKRFDSMAGCHACVNRFLEWSVGFAERAEAELFGANHQLWLERIQEESQNLQLALRLAIQTPLRSSFPASLLSSHQSSRSEVVGDPLSVIGKRDEWIGLRLSTALWNYWNVTGEHRTAIEWLEAALRVAYDPQSEELDRAELRIKAMMEMGKSAYFMSDYTRAHRYLEECLDLSLQAGDEKNAMKAMGNLANVFNARGDYDSAGVLFGQCLAEAHKQNDQHAVSLTLGNLAIVAGLQKDYAGAIALHEESLALFREQGNHNNTSLGLINMSHILFQAGQLEAAATALKEGMSLAIALNSVRLMALALVNYSTLMVLHERWNLAATVMGAASAMFARHEGPLHASGIAQFEREYQMARTALGETAFHTALQRGRTMPITELVPLLQQ